jgi:pimeloyl-ACP methyl ester carboxylesterase
VDTDRASQADAVTAIRFRSVKFETLEKGMHMRTVTSKTVTSKDGTVIAFEKSGKGPAVLLVDGTMGYRGYLGSRPLAAELSKSFTVITYDRRGRGESTDTQPYSVEREIEDIETLIDEVGGPVYLYGFSSGSVLALKAASRLGDKIAKLALFEPPLNSNDYEAKQEFAVYSKRIAELLQANQRGDAVAAFLADMIPAEVLESMRQSPEWPVMEAVAPTIAYDNAVMGDGSLPIEDAKAATMPTLVLDGGASPDFKHEAADALAKAMPHAQRKTLEAQTTMVSPESLVPVLVEFFAA